MRDSLLWHIPGYRRVLNRIIHRNIVIARAALDVSGKKIFFDASKGIGRAFILAKSDQLQFKLIHLVRNPKGVLNSYVKRRPNISTRKILNYWNRTHLAAVRLKSILPKHSYILVNYEQLCKKPIETIAEICRFLGVKAMDLPSLVNERPHHIIGNDMRLNFFSGFKQDEAWRQNLTSSQLAECDKISGRIMMQFGK